MENSSMAKTRSPELLRVFYFWTGILILKLLAMPMLTFRQRLRKRVFSNHEDARIWKGGRVAFDDEDVERVRRSHLNDLENVYAWIFITYFYLGTDPSNFIAGMLIRIFVISRVCHTLFYAISPNQPLRGVTFNIGFAITAFQTISLILYTWSHGIVSECVETYASKTTEF